MFSLNVTVLSYITINRLYSMLLKHCKFALRYELGCEMFSTLPMTSFNSYFYCCFFLLLLLFFFFTFSTSFYFFLPHLLEVIQIFVASMYSGSTLDCCFSDLVHFFILEPMKFWWGSIENTAFFGNTESDCLCTNCLTKIIHHYRHHHSFG